jgi:hypothetical protein
MNARDLGGPEASDRLSSFCRPLWLSGWSDRSVWGYDASVGSYFAQLWRDCDLSDSPTAWIDGSHQIERRGQLARLIASRVDREPAQVLAAMEAHPHTR